MSLVRLLCLLVFALLMVACGSASEDELRQWMSAQKSQTRPKIAAITEPKQFKPENYTQVSSTEPFSKEKLTQALKGESTQPTGLLG